MNVLMKSDCRKFSPNIFNKSKCQNCFRTKEAHTAEALECNRATRKVAKCGYLFVAPDWDFSVSINRTKRWQRRWFILYDDGELTYSVDEHPNTIPQALIDMNKVLEVSDAEQLTGNQFSLAITAPERVHFVKGTSRDETKWWYDLLSHYPHGTVRARHKRNATFSGSTTTTTKNTGTNNNNNQQDIPTFERYSRTQNLCETNNNNINNNNKNSSGGVELQWSPLSPVIDESNSSVQIEEVAKEILEPLQNEDQSRDDDEKRLNNLSRTEEIENLNNLIISSLNNLTPISPNKESDNSASLDSKNGNIVRTSPTNVIQCETEPVKGSSRRYVKRENRGLRSQRSRSDGVAKMIPSSANNTSQGSLPRNTKYMSEPLAGESYNSHQNPVYLLLTESKLPVGDVTDGVKRLQKSPMVERKRHASMGQEKSKDHKSKSITNNAQEESTEIAEPSFLQSPLLVRRNSLASTRGLTRKLQEDRPSSLSRSSPFARLDCSPLLSRRSNPCSRNNSFRKETNSPAPLVRGDPDGCQPSQEMLIETGKNGAVEKKGWLLRLGIHKEWYKHWFVLKNSTLSYFRDPSAENSGIMDGILDLGLVKDVQETASDRNHAFCVTTWDNKKHVLAAMMPAVRSSWVEEIILAANLGTRGKSRTKNECEEEVSTDVSNLLLPLLDERQDKGEVSKKKLESAVSIDCASSTSSSDDHSEYFSVVDEDDLASRSSSPKALPPSPPINRTAISRVKQKARSRSSSRTRMGNRKLRSSSDLSSTSLEGGDADEFAQSDTETVTTSPPPKTESTKDLILQSSSPILRDTSNDSISQDSFPDGNVTSGSYRTLVDKYNYLRKQLDEHSVCDISSVSLSAQGVLKLLADCRVCLSRVQEALQEKGDICRDDLGAEWKLFKLVYSELDKLVRIPSEEETLTQKDISELSSAVQKAREEIRKLKKDLKSSQDSFDDLELHCYKLKQDTKTTTENHKSQMFLMTARVDDLTSKLTSSERSLRLAKQRVAKLEARQERRRSSLKGKEAVSLSKEFEGKLSELEQKIGTIETSLLSSTTPEIFDVLNSKGRIGQEGQETSSTNMLLRLHSLDSKVKSAEIVATASDRSERELTPQESISSQDSSQAHPLEKPKICLQVKGSLNDDSASFVGVDDGIEHWSSLSVTTSMSDLHTIEPEEELPGTMEECLNALTQKLDILLTWLQGSFRLLGNPNAYSLCGMDQRLPAEHSEAARKLEELLSSRGGMDESTSDLVFYLHLLKEAAVSVKRLAEPHSTVERENLKMQPLLARLIRAGSKINLILDLESQPLDFLDCVQKLLRLATPTYESGSCGVSFEEVSALLESQISKLQVNKESKLEEATSSQTDEKNICEFDIQELYRPLNDVTNELTELLEHYGPSCCSEFPPQVSPSSEDITPIKVLKLELENLRLSLDKQRDRWNPSSVERLAVICTVSALLRVILPSLEYNNCCITENEGKWSLNIVVGMLEIILVRWTSQLIFTTASSLSDVLRSKDVEVSELKSIVEGLKDEERNRRASPCLTCCDLQKQVCRLQTDLRAYQRRVGQGGTPCERCRELHRRLEILSERHQMELAAALEREREEHRAEMQSRLSEVMLSHESEKRQDQEEVAQLRRDVRVSENQVKALKKQFQDQMSTLKSAYEEKMANTSTELLSQESRRQLQVEIQDIKSFCVKGLEAVEQSHKINLEELSQIHQLELKRLKDEKDKALAEESQATITALEAMKRTHKDELRLALEKLRTELISKTDSTSTQNCCHLEGIKSEILSLSEKYSLKCLEYSLLEEKLNSLSQQLHQSSQQVFELLINNQATSFNSEAENSLNMNQDYSETSADKLRQLLELRESQLQIERGERAKLAQQLHNARTDLAMLDVKRQELIQRHNMDHKLTEDNPKGQIALNGSENIIYGATELLTSSPSK